MNHGIHPSQPVDLLGDAANLLQVGEIPHDGLGALVDERPDGGEPLLAARVDDDVVSGLEQGSARPHDRVRRRNR